MPDLRPTCVRVPPCGPRWLAGFLGAVFGLAAGALPMAFAPLATARSVPDAAPPPSVPDAVAAALVPATGAGMAAVLAPRQAQP